MAQTFSMTTIADRYARSLFELASAGKYVTAIEKEFDSFAALIKSSDALQNLLRSPVFTSDDQLAAVSALAEHLQYKGKTAKGLFGNFLKVLAAHRRLAIYTTIQESFRQLVAEERGELAAEVTSARPLTREQEKELVATLKKAADKDIRLRISVDPAILGGLIVRLGSRQVDTSIATQLSSLKLALKEVG